MALKIFHRDKRSLARGSVFTFGTGESIETPCFVPTNEKGYLEILELSELFSLGGGVTKIPTEPFMNHFGVSFLSKFGKLKDYLNYKGSIITELAFPRKQLEEIKTPQMIEEMVTTMKELGVDGVSFKAESLKTFFSGSEEKDFLFSYLKQLRLVVNQFLKQRVHIPLFASLLWSENQELLKKNLEVLSSLSLSGFILDRNAFDEVNRELVSGLVKQVPFNYLRWVSHSRSILDIFFFVECGFDILESRFLLPLVRKAVALHRFGEIKISHKRNKKDKYPIDPECYCHTCQNYTRASLFYLYSSKSLLFQRLMMIHNIYFMNAFMAEIRLAISEGRFISFKKNFISKYLSENSSKN